MKLGSQMMSCGRTECTRGARRNGALVSISTGVNAFGDILLDLYISWSLGSTTGNFMNGVYVIASSVGFRAILAFLLGSYVDRHKKKPQMLFSHVLSLVAVTIFAVLWNASGDHVAVGLAFVLVNDFSNELLERSRISMMADMLSRDDFMKFQNVNGAIARVVSTGGASLAGLIVDNFSFESIVGIDVVSYAVSLLAILLVEHREMPVAVKRGSLVKTLASDVRITITEISKSRSLRSFVIIMIVLNLAYGFMPSAFPLIKSSGASAGLYGSIRAGVTVGEVIGLMVATRYSRHVSGLFGLGLLADTVIVLLICAADSPIVLIMLFSLYGMFDSLTQPLCNYVVSGLDPDNRGKLLGGIDGIVMLTPSIGIVILSNAFGLAPFFGAILLVSVFLTGLAVFVSNQELCRINIKSEDGR